MAAGIEDGLQRGIVIVPKSKAETKVAEDVSVHVLIDAGFTLLGAWIASDTGIGRSTPAPRDPGVYAFAVDGLVKYIGLTKSGFHRRMYSYQRPGATQSTSIRIHQIIADHVAAGSTVEIYLAIPPALEWNGLPINTSAGSRPA